LGLKAIGRLLNSLADEAAKKAPRLASHGGGFDMDYTAENPVALTCTCGGALRKITKGTYTQYRCHIGHTFGTLGLATEQFEQLRGVLESAARMLNERGKFFRATASEARLGKQEQAARAWEAAAEESEVRFDELTKLVAADWKRPDLVPASGGKLKPRAPGNGEPARRAASSAMSLRKRGRSQGDAATAKRAANGRKASA
jgi:hypothetical protein